MEVGFSYLWQGLPLRNCQGLVLSPVLIQTTIAIWAQDQHVDPSGVSNPLPPWSRDARTLLGQDKRSRSNRRRRFEEQARMKLWAGVGSGLLGQRALKGWAKLWPGLEPLDAGRKQGRNGKG